MLHQNLGRPTKPAFPESNDRTERSASEVSQGRHHPAGCSVNATFVDRHQPIPAAARFDPTLGEKGWEEDTSNGTQLQLLGVILSRLAFLPQPVRFVVAGDDFEAEVFDHLEVEFGGWPFVMR